MLLPNPHPGAPELATHKVIVRQAMDTLSYNEMDALANMYTRWALNEPALDGDQCTRLIELSSDYERIAEFVGQSWKPSNPEHPPGAVAFVARLELRDGQARTRLKLIRQIGKAADSDLSN